VAGERHQSRRPQRIGGPQHDDVADVVETDTDGDTGIAQPLDRCEAPAAAGPPLQAEVLTGQTTTATPAVAKTSA
jgi:hypothetical protein